MAAVRGIYEFCLLLCLIFLAVAALDGLPEWELSGRRM